MIVSIMLLVAHAAYTVVDDAIDVVVIVDVTVVKLSVGLTVEVDVTVVVVAVQVGGGTDTLHVTLNGNPGGFFIPSGRG